MDVRGLDIGVCGWSLRPGSTSDLVRLVGELGLEHVQVALRPLLKLDDGARAADVKALRDSGLTITASMVSFDGEDYTTLATIRRSGGFLPDDLWKQRHELAVRAGELAGELGTKYLSCHLGFIPSSSDAFYPVLIERISSVAQDIAKYDVSLLGETGQESASELLQFLNDLNCRNIGVNFDPANMVLYGSGDPIEAVGMLGRHIRHVHVKDAISSDQPRTQWGKEVALGNGEIDPLLFVDALEDAGYKGALCIERESGNDRIGDIRATIALLKSVADPATDAT